MSVEYCINCKYGRDTDFCRRDLKTQLSTFSKACENFIKSKIKPQEPEMVKAIGMYTNNMQLAEEIQKVTPFYYDESRNFWLWKKLEKFWKRIDETDILNSTRKESGEYVIDSTTQRELITAIKMTGRERDVKPVNKNWINAADNVFDITTKEQFKATSDYFFPAPIPHKIGLDEDTQTIDKLFKDWIGENTAILYEICAYCLIDDYPIHRMFILFGRGRNGKGQFLELLERFIGSQNTVATDLDLLISSRFEASKLYKKKIAKIGETNFNELKNTGKLKMLTGGDLIGGEFKHKEPFDFKNTAKIIIATNSLPEAIDKTDGFYSRAVTLEFKNQFQEGKDIINTIPEIEYENLLLRCLNLLPGLLERGKFTGEGTIRDKAETYERISNPFPTFKDKELTEDINLQCPVWVLRDMYAVFCAKNGYREIGDREFTQKLTKEGYETKRLYYGKKKWNTVFGLSPKTPFIYSEDIDKNSGLKNQDAGLLRPDGRDVCNNTPHRELTQTSGLSGLSGLNVALEKASAIESQNDKKTTMSVPSGLSNTLTELSKQIFDAGNEFSKQFGVINSGNIVKFSMWLVEHYHPKWQNNGESGEYTPSAIRGIASKLYKLTPTAPENITGVNRS